MPTELVKGDIFEDPGHPGGPRAFAFGGDCSGAMEAGIAVAFRKRWPAFAAAYAARCADKKFQLGDVFAWREGDVIVYALGLTRDGGKPEIGTLERAMRAMIEQATKDGALRVALPRLGAGKEGLDWTRAKKVLTEMGSATPLALVVYEQFVRAKAPA